MVQTAAASLETVRRFINEVAKVIPVAQVYLFGSHADGRAAPDSDIDIAVISPAFATLSPMDRLVILAKLAWKANTPEVEAIGYTTEEFQNAPPWEFPAEIRDHGRLIR